MRYSKFSRAPFHNKKEINGTDAVLKVTHTPALRPTLKIFFSKLADHKIWYT